MDEDSPYINSGVMLMNLPALRAEQDMQAVFDYMDTHKGRLMLPDQDIISALYGQRILPLDPIRYNMTEKLFALHRHNGDGVLQGGGFSTGGERPRWNCVCEALKSGIEECGGRGMPGQQERSSGKERLRV